MWMFRVTTVFVEISVTDEGTGFSKEALCHAQERFYMGDQSRNSKFESEQSRLYDF